MTLAQLREKYQQSPTGGPVLCCNEDGSISDGVGIVAEFGSYCDAISALKRAGFVQYMDWNAFIAF